MEKQTTEPFDYEVAKQKLREQFRTGKSLFGKGGAFAPLFQEMLNSMLEGEIDGHLDEQERDTGNRKNGKSGKSGHLDHPPPVSFDQEERWYSILFLVNRFRI